MGAGHDQRFESGGPSPAEHVVGLATAQQRPSKGHGDRLMVSRSVGEEALAQGIAAAAEDAVPVGPPAVVVTAGMR